jgi:hypothetical protein
LKGCFQGQQGVAGGCGFLRVKAGLHRKKVASVREGGKTDKRTIVRYNEGVKKAINDFEHLATLQDYYAQHRVLPSYTRLMSLLGFASKSGIKKVLDRLQEAGMLERTSDGDWSPTDRFFDRSIANLPVAAGMPLPTADEGGEQMTLDRFLIARPANTVLVRVKGDSMINAGIHSGDLAVRWWSRSLMMNSH